MMPSPGCALPQGPGTRQGRRLLFVLVVAAVFLSAAILLLRRFLGAPPPPLGRAGRALAGLAANASLSPPTRGWWSSGGSRSRPRACRRDACRRGITAYA